MFDSDQVQSHVRAQERKRSWRKHGTLYREARSLYTVRLRGTQKRAFSINEIILINGIETSPFMLMWIKDKEPAADPRSASDSGRIM